MNITTILPPSTFSAIVVRADVLAFLRRHAETPLSVERVSDRLGMQHALVRQAFRELNGPVHDDDGNPGAYVHFATCSNQAVFIP